MGIVSFALRFKHTFYVLAMMMLFLGGSAIFVTPKDIFPNIDIPVVGPYARGDGPARQHL